jgi:small nuclear ribonucleoprotein D3
MSVVGNNRVGIPIVLLHDAEGAVVTVETKNGQLIRGLLFEAEDMMNLYLKNAVITSPTGVKRKSNQIYIRGPEIVFILLPDMLKHAPMFQRYVYISSFWRMSVKTISIDRVFFRLVAREVSSLLSSSKHKRFHILQNQALAEARWSSSGRCRCCSWTSGCHSTKGK